MYFFLDLYDNPVPCDFDTWEATVGERGIYLARTLISLPDDCSPDGMSVTCLFTGVGATPWEVRLDCPLFIQIKQAFATRQEAIARHTEISDQLRDAPDERMR